MGDVSKVRVPLEVVLGAANPTVEEVSQIGEGTIIELDRLAGEPVILRIAGRDVGRAEVVVIDESFGVRVTEISAAAPEVGSHE